MTLNLNVRRAEKMSGKVSDSNYCMHEWRKIGYDDTYEDAQLLHHMTKKLKREDDPDYDPDLHVDGDSPRPNNSQYFQKPIFQCPECVRSYKSPVRMANHYRDKHPEKDTRSPYSRYPTQRDKRHYDYPPAPRSPESREYPYISSPYDYSHKHTRHQAERDRYTANENTQLITYKQSPLTARTVSNNILFSNSLPTTGRTPDTSNSSPNTSPSSSPSISPTTSSPTHSDTRPSPPSTPAILQKPLEDKTISINGRTYQCKGIRISTIVEEFKFSMFALPPPLNNENIECLEKNKQRLHLANIAYNQGLISPEEYAKKQREFLNAFSFF